MESFMSLNLFIPNIFYHCIVLNFINCPEAKLRREGIEGREEIE
jgi:hypothetical protein